MKMSTKLFIAGAILLLIPIKITIPFGFLCVMAGFILIIYQGFKEIDNKNNSRTDTSKMKYTYEARRACENVTPKRKQDEKPPWEE